MEKASNEEEQNEEQCWSDDVHLARCNLVSQLDHAPHGRLGGAVNNMFSVISGMMYIIHACQEGHHHCHRHRHVTVTFILITNLEV